MISSHSSAVGAGIGHEVDPQARAMCSSSVARSDVLTSRSGTPPYRGDGSIDDCIASLPAPESLDGSVVTVTAKADSEDNPLPTPAATGAGEPASPRASSSLRAGWQRLVRWNARLEDSLLGDLIGAVCLFALGYLLFVMAGVLQ